MRCLYLHRLAGFKRGFAIGSTVDPCTIGIYMWIVDSDYISGYSPPQHVTMILLDTEVHCSLPLGTWFF